MSKKKSTQLWCLGDFVYVSVIDDSVPPKKKKKKKPKRVNVLGFIFSKNKDGTYAIATASSLRAQKAIDASSNEMTPVPISSVPKEMTKLRATSENDYLLLSASYNRFPHRMVTLEIRK